MGVATLAPCVRLCNERKWVGGRDASGGPSQSHPATGFRRANDHQRYTVWTPWAQASEGS